MTSPAGAGGAAGRLRRAAAAGALPLLLVALFAGLALWRPPALEDALENPLVDWRFAARNALRPPAVPAEVVVVAIDEASLSRYGRWPWTRTRVAELIRRVAAGEPRAIGVDLFFPEPESPAADADLAGALAGIREIGAAALVFEMRRGGRFGGEVPDLLFDQALTRVEGASLLRPLEVSRALLPAEPIASAAPLGHANYLPDRNGKLRHEQLYVRYGDEYLPSLSLQVARIARRLPWEKVAILGGRGMDLAGTFVPADDHGRLFINYYGPEQTFRHLPAGDLLAGAVPPAALRDKVVFIGATAVATYDLIVTPFAAVMPGVEKNATVVANILHADYIRDAPLAVDLLVVLGCGLAVFLLCRRLRAAAAIASLALLGALLVAGSLALFAAGWHVALAWPLLLVGTQGAAAIAGRYLAEEREARATRRMFSSYVSERVVDQLIADPEMARLGGHRREITVLFSDIRGFTTFSEKHRPEEVVGILNEYLGAMTDVVFRWEGTVDKFIGDAVMAFWNAPVAQPDHAERALRCALHMLDRLAELNAGWAARGLEPLAIGIGINTGEVLVGNIGAEGKKMDYTVIGDHVNLGSRLEGLTKRYDSRILIAAGTLAKIRPQLEANRFGHLAVRGVGNVAVKGKETAVRIYALAPAPHGEATVVEESAGDEVVHMTEK